MKKVKKCIYEDKPCTGCGDCICDLDPDKICDNCMKCVKGEAAFRAITISGIEMPHQSDDSSAE